MKSISSRLEKIEAMNKHRMGSGAKLVIVDLADYEAVGGDISKLKGIPIHGKESIVIIDDVPEDEGQ